MIRLLLRVLGAEYSRPVRRTIALMTAAALLEGLSYALLVPVLRALLSGAPADAVPWLAAFAGAVAVFASLRYAADLSGFLTGGALLRGMYHRLGDHLTRLPVGWFGGGRAGEVSVLAGTGVLQAMGVIAHQLAPLVTATVTPLATIAVVLAFDWRLGLAALAAVPAVAAAQYLSGRASAAADAARADTEREAADRTIEYIRAQPVLRAGGRSRERFGLLDDALQGLQRASRRSALAALPGVLGLAFTVQAAFTAMLVLGAHLALGGTIDAAELLCILVLATRCTDPVLSLAHAGGALRAARGELERLDAVLRAAPLPEPSDPVRPDRHDLAFEGVTFRRGDRTVLDGVDLSVPDGGRLAIVGPSGAGKSTLLQSLARFHDVDAGSVRVGGVDVRSIGTDDLMARIAVVFQDVYLFDDTIEENVRLGRPDADGDAVLEAARAARLDEVVARLPDGWATNVGEGGALLSGGERQRVSIARALLKDAPIVLLDEVTSALDPGNEAAVHAGIERLSAGRTVVLVTHRMPTAMHADRIAFLDGGRVVEAGTHDELLRLGGRYAGFWRAAAVPAEHG
ncbi:ABC transporter ATP-binding protein [Nocardiopsis sp. RSe5-2]|uniref:ABC transporter ATP-binding protein n=1 Tax=Nocardiopsis endophytica TaxID=3018445 RepID=A0ABT4TWY4_9ACTN|nr:ABC transporter ATP-binding protein [Nocardiopsis endophytica]MDA2809205.1 ABC transporter ATP-binding protein [Nocardiopsis endophytica]